MPIQLDKILADIAQEKLLHPNYPDPNKKDLDDAWMRVGKKNNLSVHEARSIFKVLQKKYEQEKNKETSSWKLFNIMEQIHQKIEIKSDIKQEDESDLPIDEDEEYEMLEVQEDEEHAGIGQAQSNSGGNSSDGESPSKSIKSNSSNGSPEKDDRQPAKLGNASKQTSNSLALSSSNYTATNVEEKKLLNTMASASPRPPPSNTPQSASATAVALQKKGIILKKTTSSSPSCSNMTGTKLAGTNTPANKSLTVRPSSHAFEVGKTIQLPESIKRKLSEDQPTSTQIKKMNIVQGLSPGSMSSTAMKSPPQATHTTTAQLMQVKQEREDQSNQVTNTTSTHNINLITIPGNPRVDLSNGIVGGASSSTAATVASTSTNGFSPRIEEIDFRNDIIFDAGNGVNGTGSTKLNANASEIINLGNFDNSLPPTFFKNLCNSSRHEALGLYVANVMNRLRPRSAAKLELGILRAIIDVQSDELEQ